MWYVLNLDTVFEILTDLSPFPYNRLSLEYASIFGSEAVVLLGAKIVAGASSSGTALSLR